MEKAQELTEIILANHGNDKVIVALAKESVKENDATTIFCKHYRRINKVIKKKSTVMTL